MANHKSHYAHFISYTLRNITKTGAFSHMRSSWRGMRGRDTQISLRFGFYSYRSSLYSCTVRSGKTNFAIFGTDFSRPNERSRVLFGVWFTHALWLYHTPIRLVVYINRRLESVPQIANRQNRDRRGGFWGMCFKI